MLAEAMITDLRPRNCRHWLIYENRLAAVLMCRLGTKLLNQSNRSLVRSKSSQFRRLSCRLMVEILPDYLRPASRALPRPCSWRNVWNPRLNQNRLRNDREGLRHNDVLRSIRFRPMSVGVTPVLEKGGPSRISVSCAQRHCTF